MANLKEITLPDIGDFKDVEVIEVLVSAGDTISAEDSLITLESDKASMEIPSPVGGLIKEVKVKVGDIINQGDLLVVVDQETAPEETAPVAPPKPVDSIPHPAPPAPGEKKAKPLPVAPTQDDMPSRKAHASPAVRRFARELGVDLGRVQGSAPKGRITKKDVQNFVKSTLSSSGAATSAGGSLALPSMPEVDFSRFGPVEEVELGRIKKISGAHLHRSWITVPHVTQFDEADITDLEAFRKGQKDEALKQDVRLTFMPFLMKACEAALREFPEVNASLSPNGEHLIMKKYLHIGVAVDTPNGLVVPVIRDVDQKGVYDLARELMDISTKARDGKLGPADMQGGCFTISSLGGIGGTQFTPIVNAPEVAILGVSRASMKPVWNGKKFKPRLVMPFSLSYDHRVIDGAQGVRFTTYLAGLLSDIRRLVL
ncbi:dihydrolipoyllysine-residue acetyltransferase [Thiolapillus brandeum]|uniref:Acetyltransferase component of pyruvate dehydrogenase complex n=1 Tax=Thiolapillus brandeum TaxID=1076588 RepID=A0A7U6GHZ0_9GAMM|nr:dihydrolipoyllysine-residue acetyltransferase [Thiolapillus brandeum]BAO43983.1 pyruvate dehydrogenase E2 component (dihydrolipoamide acetyltransferase) [Thiolapillus brandeum]